MGYLAKVLDRLSGGMRDYCDRRIFSLKYSTVKSLSAACSKLAGLAAVFCVAALALTMLIFGLVLLLGEAMGSYACAALTVAGGLAVTAILLLCLGKRLFKGTFDRLFTKMMFDHEPVDEHLLKLMLSEKRKSDNV